MGLVFAYQSYCFWFNIKFCEAICCMVVSILNRSCKVTLTIIDSHFYIEFSSFDVSLADFSPPPNVLFMISFMELVLEIGALLPLAGLFNAFT